MSLDDLSPLPAHKRERESYDAQAEQDWLVQQDCESVEAMESMWDGAFAQVPPMLSRQHWPEGPDRRCFAVDGELVEDARRDLEHDRRGEVA